MVNLSASPLLLFTLVVTYQILPGFCQLDSALPLFTGPSLSFVYFLSSLVISISIFPSPLLLPSFVLDGRQDLDVHTFTNTGSAFSGNS